MIKIGEDYYKNLWAFVLVKVFNAPPLIVPKDIEFLPIQTFPSNRYQREMFAYQKWAEEMMMVKKTITVGANIDDNPSVTICRGHVNATEFNQAWKNEGWKGNDWIHKSELKHEYWTETDGFWKRCLHEVKGAEKVTVMYW